MAKTDPTPDPTPSPFPDIAKLIEQFRVPGLDVGKLVEARRKDIEALTQANQAAYEGMQELAKRQMEILQETVNEWQAATMQATNRESTSVSQRAELAEKTFCKAFANMRELAELAVKAQTKAWEVIQKRFQENIADLGNLLRPQK